MNAERVADTPKPGSDIGELVRRVSLWLAYLFRWPFAPFWMRQDLDHNYHLLTEQGKSWFILLCLSGMVVEAALAWGLLVQPLLGAGISMSLLTKVIFAVLFVVLTAVRFNIWWNQFKL